MEPMLYLDESWRVDDGGRRHLISHALHVEDVLGKADNVFKTLRKMKRHDRDAYDLFSRIGAPVATEHSLFAPGKEEPTFRARLPAFQACFLAYGDDEKGKERFWTKCSGLYLQRVERPCWVDAAPGAVIYAIKGLWVCRDRRSLGDIPFADSAHVALEPGGIRFLRQTEVDFQRIPRSKSGPRQYRAGASIPHVCRRIPLWLQDKADDHKTTPQDVAEWMFNMLTWCKPEPGILCRAFKGGESIAFTVGKRDASRFFADRGLRDNRKRKILHYVRGHYRADEAFVRPHYRGERDFWWHGMHVRMSVPDWHAPAVERFSAASFEPEGERQAAGMTTADLGARLSAEMSRDFFLSRKSYRH